MLDINDKVKYDIYQNDLKKMKKMCLFSISSLLNSILCWIIAIVLFCLWAFHEASDYVINGAKDYTVQEKIHNHHLFVVSVFFFVWFIINCIIHIIVNVLIRSKLNNLRSLYDNVDQILLLYRLSFFIFILSIVATIMTLNKTNKLLIELKKVNVNELDNYSINKGLVDPELFA